MYNILILTYVGQADCARFHVNIL